MPERTINAAQDHDEGVDPRPKRRLTPLRIAILCGAMLAVLLLIYLFPDGTSPKTGTVIVHAPAKQDVQAEAEIDQSVLPEKGSVVTLHLRVTNQSKKTIASPYLGVFAPGFDAPGGTPQCVNESGQPAGSQLDVGHSCTFTVPLKSLARSGAYSITATIGWGLSATDSISVRLGPVSIDGTFGAVKWARFGHRIGEILKDLTLPLLLLFLTNYYTTKQKEREDEAARQQKEREAEASRAQERRTQRQQIRQLLLNQVMENAQKHYMPITACSVLVLRELEKIEKKEKDASSDRLLFQTLTLVRLLDSFRRERGGFFLKRIEAEKLVGFSWLALKETLFSVLTDEQVDLAISKPNWLASNSAFLEYIDRFEVAQKRVEYWIEKGEPADGGPGRNRGKFSEYAGLIDIMQAVLRHEVNHILMDDWYDEEKVPDDWSFIRKTTTLPSSGELTATQVDKIAFISDRLTPYCKRTVG